MTTCNNPKAGGTGTVACTNTAGVAGDLACAVLTKIPIYHKLNNYFKQTFSYSNKDSDFWRNR